MTRNGSGKTRQDQCVCVRSNLPPHTLGSQKSGTKAMDSSQYGNDFFKGDLAKNALFESYGVICLLQQSAATMQCS